MTSILVFLQLLSHLSPSVVCLQETHAVSNDDLFSWFSPFGYFCAGSFGINHFRVLFCIVRYWSVGLLFANSIVVLFWLSLVFVLLFSVLLLFMLETVILIVMLFLFAVLILSILLFLLFCAAISTRSWTVFWIAAGLVLLMSLAKVLLCCRLCFWIVVDIWCEKHPTDSAFTWCLPDGTLASRIDLIGCLYACRVRFLTIVLFLFHGLSPTPFLRMWKLNRSVLDEAEYIDLISTFWSYWQSRQSSFSSLTRWWDSGKSIFNL